MQNRTQMFRLSSQPRSSSSAASGVGWGRGAFWISVKKSGSTGGERFGRVQVGCLWRKRSLVSGCRKFVAIEGPTSAVLEVSSMFLEVPRVSTTCSEHTKTSARR